MPLPDMKFLNLYNVTCCQMFQGVIPSMGVLGRDMRPPEGHREHAENQEAELVEREAHQSLAEQPS